MWTPTKPEGCVFASRAHHGQCLKQQQSCMYAATGCALHVSNAILNVASQDGSGKVSLRMLQNYASKYGGETLTLEDLKSLFEDFKPTHDGLFGLKEFLIFFSQVCHQHQMQQSSQSASAAAAST